MNLKFNILLVFILIGLFGCDRQWEEHYSITSETTEMNIWDALQENEEVSSFVLELESFGYDTLFNTTNSFTLFIPSNDALEVYKNGNDVNRLLLDYLITPHFIQSGNIDGKRKIQTLGQKFILFENNGSDIKVDGIQIISESPLYKNGKFFILDQVAAVKPNLYEFFAVENPILKNYIDDQDSLILDKQNSEPIGRNDNGDIIYDTVANIFNKFENTFFPVRQESRFQSATIVFPKSEDYNSALTEMAQDLNSAGMADYRDIPLDWQNRILLPFLLDQGIFPNMLEQEEFLWTAQTNEIWLKNISGDTVLISYKPVDKTICSNGYAYNYESFSIPDSLYANPTIYEGESLLRQIGVNKYTWQEGVTAQSDESFIPEKIFTNEASNDSVMQLLFPMNYDGNFSLEFNFPPVFPRQYLMVVSVNMLFGGIYDIYIDDEPIGTFDYKDFADNRYAFNWSSVTSERYRAEGNICKFDLLLDNITEYKNIKIKFVYTGPSESLVGNGLIIDNISLKPYQ